MWENSLTYREAMTSHQQVRLARLVSWVVGHDHGGNLGFREGGEFPVYLVLCPGLIGLVKELGESKRVLVWAGVRSVGAIATMV